MMLLLPFQKLSSLGLLLFLSSDHKDRLKTKLSNKLSNSTKLRKLTEKSSKVKKLSNYFTGSVSHDERLIFFPTAAHKLNETHWHLPIHGWMFKPELDSIKRKAAVKSIGKVLFQTSTQEEKDILKRRLMPFVADNKSMKYVNIKFTDDNNSNNDINDNPVYRLSRSSKDGHFHANLTIHEEELLQLNKDIGKGTTILRYEAVEDTTTSIDGRIFSGVVHMIPPTGGGVSVISDIDDTVKITNYLNKSEFYKNTFVRKFQVVPDMEKVYDAIRSRHQDCAFHYVSASPFQLYEDLSEFLIHEHNFPPATFHLKQIRIKDKTLFQFFADPVEYKLKQITPLFEKYPNRKFILVGDSGEKDPEIYAQLYNNYPNQIHKIYIRNVNNSTSERMNDLIKVTSAGNNAGGGGGEGQLWQYFGNGTDLLLSL